MIEVKATPIETFEAPSESKTKEKLTEVYNQIVEILKRYLDLNEDYYNLIAIWIMGTHIHEKFESYPYLYFNAMRGSGKSRTLRLICKLSYNGTPMTSPTEATLFRTKGTLGIDEFERVISKDKNALRELLNSAYKKGMKVFRMKKSNEKYVVEEFEPYRPIIMANIWGMEEVLEDRCITLILEKSGDLKKTRLTEDFETSTSIKNAILSIKRCSLWNVVSPQNAYSKWNTYITYNTFNTNNTDNTLNSSLIKLFKKIDKTAIQGRDLELYLPLFIIANSIGKEQLNQLIKTAVESTEQRKHEQEVESVDVMVMDFVSRQAEGWEYHSVKELVNKFREFSNESADWINARWFGRALKRLNLVIDKKRKGFGIEVMLNVKKAHEKMKMFKTGKTETFK
jgi:hypothetical protein